MGASLLVVGAALVVGLIGPSAGGTSRAEAYAACDSHGATTCAANASDQGAYVSLPLSTGKPRLLEFMSGHCAACARMAPVVAAIERRCAAMDGTIVRINVDEPSGEALAARYGVRVVPSFVSVDSQGRETERVVGELPADRLAVVVADVRGTACSAL
jgi:cytochrome c-type biogenesis protein